MPRPRARTSRPAPPRRQCRGQRGNGFPPDEIEKVFAKFYRLKDSITGGTGLGLSIVKGFVEAHGGEVHLENLPEGGAMFRIKIPAEISAIANYSE